MSDLLFNGASSPFAKTFELRWQPIPNWVGYIIPTLLMQVLPPLVVGRVMDTLTLVSVVLATLFLRHRVHGDRNWLAAALVASVTALGSLWLLGFWGFLLGVATGFVTWAVAWGRPGKTQSHQRARDIALLSALLLLGYFCHPVSFAITMLGLVALVVANGRAGLGLSATGLVLAALPVLPLVAWYATAMRSGGGFTPVYDNLQNPTSFLGWKSQLGWVDPITIASRNALPFVEARSSLYLLVSPVVALGLGLYLAWLSSWFGSRRPVPLTLRIVEADSKPAPVIRPTWIWCVLAGVLLLGGVFVPDTLGANNGNYLPQRVIMVGLLLAAVSIDLSHLTRGARGCGLAATIALGVALTLQTAFVWNYGLYASRLLAGIMSDCKESVGTNQRIGALWLDSRVPFAVNPLLHAEGLLGLNTGNVVWSNYELAHYYFPLRVRPQTPHPNADAFSTVAKTSERTERLDRWEQLLRDHHAQIDRIVMRGEALILDAVTSRWYSVAYEHPTNGIRVWKRRESDPAPTIAGS